MLTMLVEQTNVYSTQRYGSSVKTIMQELEQYIGVYLKMGLAKMLNVRCYWENGTRCSPIADKMSRNCFLMLMQYIHVVNNLEIPKEAKEKL